MIRKTAWVTLTAFLRTEEKSVNVGMTKKLHFRFPRTSRATPATIGNTVSEKNSKPVSGNTYRLPEKRYLVSV